MSLTFYDAVLATLGYSRLWASEDGAGYGARGKDEPFAIKQDAASSPLGSSPRSHFAFTAPDRKAVVAFHRAALEAGGTDGGPPGLRPHYGEHYFAAFVRDPDGYQIEAVSHSAPEETT